MAQKYPKPSILFTFKGFMAPIHCVLVNNDVLFAGTQEGKVHLWSLQTYRELCMLEASCQPIISLHYAHSTLIIQDKEGTVFLWESISDQLYKEINQLKRIEPRLSFCKCIVFNNRDKMLKSCFNVLGNALNSSPLVDQNRFKQNELATNIKLPGQFERPKVGHENSEHKENCCLHQNGAKLKDGEILVSEIHNDNDEIAKTKININGLTENNEEITEKVEESQSVPCNSLSDSTDNLNTNNSNTCLNKIVDNHSILNTSISNFNEDFYLIVPYDANDLTIFSLQTRKKVTKIDINATNRKVAGTIMCMKLVQVQTKEYLIVATEDGMITLCNIRQRTVDCQLNLSDTHTKINVDDATSGDGTPDAPMSVDFDERTMRGIIGTNSRNLYCFKLYVQYKDELKMCQSGELEKCRLAIKLVHPLHYPGVSCVRIREDGKVFSLSHWDGKGVFIYDWKSLKCLARVDVTYQTVHDLYFFHDMLAVASDGKVSIWKLHR